MIEGIDKVTVTAHYDDRGLCRSIYVYLNDDMISTSDVAAAVKAVFKPEAHHDTWNAVTVGSQTVVPQPSVRVNGSDVVAPTPGKTGWF